jgi:hypothetical protein
MKKAGRRRKEETYFEGLCRVTSDLITATNSAPTAVEICQRYCDKGRVSPAMVEEVKGLLGKIAHSLEERCNLKLCLVGEGFYKRGSPPVNQDEARACLPRGRRRPVGIRLCKDEHDLIYLEKIKQNYAAGGGKQRANHDRVLGLHQAGLCSDSQAAGLLTFGAKLAQPSNAALASEVMKALPSGTESGAAKLSSA